MPLLGTLPHPAGHLLGPDWGTPHLTIWPQPLGTRCLAVNATCVACTAHSHDRQVLIFECCAGMKGIDFGCSLVAPLATGD